VIGNITKGRGFRGVLDYLLDKEQGELIGGNMLGEDARELAAEFKLSRSLNPDIKQPVFHASLSLPKREDHAEHIDSERWNQLAADYLQRMGFTRNQYVVVRHFDREHDHIHIVASRIRLDQSLVDDSWERIKSQQVIRQLEQEYNLTPVLSSWEVNRRDLTKGQYELSRREVAASLTPTPSVKQRIQDIADRVLQKCDTPEQFIQKMQETGVQIQTRTRRDGSISGISYQYTVDGTTVATPGTKLGTDYSWNGIQRRIQELSQQQTQSGLEKYTDVELLLVPSSVANYFAASPPKPPQEEDKRLRTEIEKLRSERNRISGIHHQKLEEIEKIPGFMMVLPHIRKKWDDFTAQAEKIMTAWEQTSDKLKQANASLEQWQQQEKTYQDWVANPQTLAMRQLAFDLKLPHVQSRLEELQQRHVASELIQREGRATAQAVQDMFRLTGTKRQPDGSLILDGNNWRVKQLGDTVSVTVKADDREILRAEGSKVVVFEVTPEERQKMQHFREQVHSALLKEQQRQLEAERKRDRGLSL